MDDFLDEMFDLDDGELDDIEEMEEVSFITEDFTEDEDEDFDEYDDEDFDGDEDDC